MKRKNSKATFYRKMKRGIATCLDLLQDCFLDCSNLSTLIISNTISESKAITAENLKDFQIINSEINISNNSDS